jgi:hypothetical protein
MWGFSFPFFFLGGGGGGGLLFFKHSLGLVKKWPIGFYYAPPAMLVALKRLKGKVGANLSQAQCRSQLQTWLLAVHLHPVHRGQTFVLAKNGGAIRFQIGTSKFEKFKNVTNFGRYGP